MQWIQQAVDQMTPKRRRPSVNVTVACTNNPRALLARSRNGPSPHALPPKLLLVYGPTSP